MREESKASLARQMMSLRKFFNLLIQLLKSCHCHLLGALQNAVEDEECYCPSLPEFPQGVHEKDTTELFDEEYSHSVYEPVSNDMSFTKIMGEPSLQGQNIIK
ncbi:hypothetical protein O6H91_09G077200 [Diphasiastrum complanatum]|uniref:Uncharacterized protein n=1 Tax=Diphasiastrum complanatum TaxID=34168 RepID=A0ACC2CQQ0_DIPCM|nr:hypothetical protein O6H91_09G077200 [Diphasiastrum complanatum]